MANIFDILKEKQGGQDYDPNIIHHFGAGVYARQATLKAGSAIQKHIHSYDHLSILGSGKVKLFKNDGTEQEFIGPACIEIKAGIEHAILALEDCVWFCVHSTEFADVDDLDEVKTGELNV